MGPSDFLNNDQCILKYRQSRIMTRSGLASVASSHGCLVIFGTYYSLIDAHSPHFSTLRICMTYKSDLKTSNSGLVL